MHRLALRRAEAVSHGKSVGLDAHGVDHQHVAFPTTDRIAHSRRRQILRMCAVHTNVANIVVLTINNGDIAVVLRQHLEAELHREGERRRHRTALVLRIGKALARDGELTLLPHDRRSRRRENRIMIVADQLAGIAGAVRTAAQIPQRLRTRWHRLEIERVLAPASPCDTRRAVRPKRRQSERRRGENAEEQSLAFHLMSPSRPFFLSARVRPMASLSVTLPREADKTPSADGLRTIPNGPHPEEAALLSLSKDARPSRRMDPGTDSFNPSRRIAARCSSG